MPYFLQKRQPDNQALKKNSDNFSQKWFFRSILSYNKNDIPKKLNLGGFIMNETIPNLLKKYRLNCGYSQQMVANTLNIDRSTYTYYETGKSMPSMNTILILKNLFKIPYDELISCFDSSALLAVKKLNDPTIEDKHEEPDLSNCRKKIMLDKTSIYELPKEEQQLILYYRRLNQKDKEKLMGELHNHIKDNY